MTTMTATTNVPFEFLAAELQDYDDLNHYMLAGLRSAIRTLSRNDGRWDATKTATILEGLKIELRRQLASKARISKWFAAREVA